MSYGPDRQAPSPPAGGDVTRAPRSLAACALALLPVVQDQGPGDISLSVEPGIVAQLETRTPPMTEFLLRGTVPIPPGVYPRADGLNPFVILDPDGSPQQTQVEIVSRYPAEENGADVVELLARVHSYPALQPGEPARYPVFLRANPAASLPTGLEPVTEAVQQLLEDPDGIEITGYDCFGNKYVCRPLDAQRDLKVLHHGPVLAEALIYQEMLPEPALAPGALPHLLGVHSYVSWARESSSVGLDLRFHNAHDGHDPLSPLDDPLGKMYFQRLEISLPEGWVLLQDFADPHFGDERLEGGRRIVTLVAQNWGGGLHVMRWGAQFHRRLMLAPDTPKTRAVARQQLDGAGRAFCVRGDSPSGRPLWSWWNLDTARYFPQRHQLPQLDHVGRAVLDEQIRVEYEKFAAHLASGSGDGVYPFLAPVLGWGHPYGVLYGGMTGGLEIDFFDGIEVAAAASPLGLRSFMALHRMQTDRQPNALYQESGEPSSVEEWLVENGALDYLPFEHFVVPFVFGSRPDPFGVRSAPRFQVDFVQAMGMQPPYEETHLGFDPYDYQHFVRYTRAAKVLAWLANDSLAIDDLRMQAENFNMSFHPYAFDPFGGAQGSGMLSKRRYVDAFPGKGFPYGRGEAWGLDCAAAAYSTSDLGWRERKRPWFEQQIELISDGQSSCSGFIQAFVSSKAVNGRYQARQLIEQVITENALLGAHQSVFRGADPGHAIMVRDVMVKSLRALVGEMAWFPGEFGPWRYTGVGPLDPSLTPWCSRAEMPADAFTAGDIDTYQDWASLAYGYELTLDTLFLRHARFQVGGANFDELFQTLKASGTDNLGNRAALLALCQRIEGEL